MLLMLLIMWTFIAAVIFAVSIFFLPRKSALLMAFFVPLAFAIGLVGSWLMGGVIFRSFPPQFFQSPLFTWGSIFIGFLAASATGDQVWRFCQKPSQSQVKL